MENFKLMISVLFLLVSSFAQAQVRFITPVIGVYNDTYMSNVVKYNDTWAGGDISVSFEPNTDIGKLIVGWKVEGSIVSGRIQPFPNIKPEIYINVAYHKFQTEPVIYYELSKNIHIYTHFAISERKYSDKETILPSNMYRYIPYADLSKEPFESFEEGLDLEAGFRYATKQFNILIRGKSMVYNRLHFLNWNRPEQFAGMDKSSYLSFGLQVNL